MYVEIKKAENHLQLFSDGADTAKAKIQRILELPPLINLLEDLLNRFANKKIIVIANSSALSADTLIRAISRLNQVVIAPSKIFRECNILVQIERIL